MRQQLPECTIEIESMVNAKHYKLIPATLGQLCGETIVSHHRGHQPFPELGSRKGHVFGMKSGRVYILIGGDTNTSDVSAWQIVETK